MMSKYSKEALSWSDYYPFGLAKDGRSSESSSYRFGFNGMEKDEDIHKGSYTAEFWQYDSRIGRRWNVDPIIKFNESSYASFSNSPIWLIDPLGSDTLVFDNNNKYSHLIEADGEHVGKKLGENGFVFNFADPENDPERIREGDITELFIPDNYTILNDLDRGGVNKSENKGIIDGPLYLLYHSNAEDSDRGELDFVHNSLIFGYKMKNGKLDATGLPENKLYITNVNNQMIAHNNSNFGNFMWGASAAALDVSLTFSLSGAHFNNYFKDAHNYGKKWYERDFDSKDDQRSIFLGWLWYNTNK